ncbi:MAG: DNA-binding transcriptional LysR family regulator [Bermanella sp.]|jgi:DNA-binding transcriptional LysR family regulator
MHIFVEVARTKSFSQAAEVLDMTSSTVSRRIAELEDEVGLRLFNRTTRQVELTDAGATYFAKCQSILELAQDAHDELTNMRVKPSGLIRVAMPVEFGTEWLAPLIPEFVLRYPDIQLELTLMPPPLNLLSDSMDIAIVFGLPTEQDAVARKILHTEIALFASPDYLKRRGIPQVPQDIADHECLHYQRGAPWQLFNINDGRNEIVKVKGQICLNLFTVLGRFAIQGLGIIPWTIEGAADDVANQRLVRILPDWVGSATDWYALTTSRRMPAKVRAFIDYLEEKSAS